ncbi:3-deoxy-manno-octulosonate cytidylyltransferase [hydrothermal vent metagenome]|uniref:3-deoxy-manno-octulosonate cytidylyltransferase n=1 Tax=hydrothermal vent metagenome TaxID=652676 RepID=A0A3B1C9T2_9ZZZZ
MSEKQKVIGVIPARYGSSRFPGKIIADIVGKPMIQRVYEQANKSKLLDDLIVAVDDERVLKCVEEFGGKAVMTKVDHQSGTDRLAEAVEKIDADIVVNIQGDQPLFDSLMIDEAVQPMLDDTTIKMSTIKTKVGKESYDDPAVVKVVTDENDFAIYFSRSLIPYSRDGADVNIYEHVGLYVYRKDFLLEISKLPQTYLEKIEMLEQLRVLEKGYKIKVIETKCESISGVSVDTPEDLKKVEKIINDMSID